MRPYSILSVIGACRCSGTYPFSLPFAAQNHGDRAEISIVL